MPTLASNEAIVQVMNRFFMQTVNLVRHQEVEPELTKLGADVVLLQDDPDLTGKIRRATGPALAVGGIDPVAGELTKVRSVKRSKNSAFRFPNTSKLKRDQLYAHATAHMEHRLQRCRIFLSHPQDQKGSGARSGNRGT